MQSDALLTQDELDFIQTMHRSPQLNLTDVTSSLRLDGGSEVQQLLTRLVAQEQVTLQANFENQQMSFPLQLVEDEFHAVSLQLGAPSIYEDGPMMRPWRLTLEPPVALDDELGLSTDLKVCEMSFRGVLVQVPRNRKPPKTFNLWFSPEADAPINLQGTLQRKTADGLAAYRLSQHQPQEIERLRQYILRQHRLAHPELHPD
ncbi:MULTISPECIES: hypothetical protein [Pseudomonas]|jgi:hypothetical protein|uniref:PilZ domain-containing protein n=1 Tax=Pseudomonas putida TaxID=303 RepID=A0A9X8HKM3_PSEPU|nr:MULTISPECIES: hypothetical protein [Pseudomonas]KIU53602.1 hypothetical protein QV12_04715 [Pseudomonas putida]KTC23214.1 hypothetical protein AO392_00440 [Pseudomonas putida]MCO7503993.1 hypothetical protein [Pseudomonas sp. VE 267-6A]MCO7530727.1 hypothetical protein [Pseudomonas sp. 2]MCP8346680.1 hypothetical protein [Pseudomonas sp. FBF18]